MDCTHHNKRNFKGLSFYKETNRDVMLYSLSFIVGMVLKHIKFGRALAVPARSMTLQNSYKSCYSPILLVYVSDDNDITTHTPPDIDDIHGTPLQELPGAYGM